MDPLAIVVTVSALYLLLCILVSLFIDADATTFLYSKLGPPVSRQLAGKVLWIVGAGRGLGAAIAVSAASRGAASCGRRTSWWRGWTWPTRRGTRPRWRACWR